MTPRKPDVGTTLEPKDNEDEDGNPKDTAEGKRKGEEADTRREATYNRIVKAEGNRRKGSKAKKQSRRLGRCRRI